MDGDAELERRRSEMQEAEQLERFLLLRDAAKDVVMAEDARAARIRDDLDSLAPRGEDDVAVIVPHLHALARY